MTEIIIEAVIMAFTLGGIAGAATALSMKNSRLWNAQHTALTDRHAVAVRVEADVDKTPRR